MIYNKVAVLTSISH